MLQLRDCSSSEVWSKCVWPYFRALLGTRLLTCQVRFMPIISTASTCFWPIRSLGCYSLMTLQLTLLMWYLPAARFQTFLLLCPVLLNYMCKPVLGGQSDSSVSLFCSLVGNWSGEDCEFFQETRRSRRGGKGPRRKMEETGSSVCRQVCSAELCTHMQTAVRRGATFCWSSHCTSCFCSWAEMLKGTVHPKKQIESLCTDHHAPRGKLGEVF